MKLLLIIALSYWQVFALGLNDTMKVNVLDILKMNRVSINRGVADGLLKNSHIKFNSDQGYTSRGIVIYSKEDFSIVQLYRIIGYNAFSRNVEYTLTSMKTSLIAPHMKRFLKKNFSDEYSGFVPRKSDIPNEVNSDLPKRTTKKEIKKAIKK